MASEKLTEKGEPDLSFVCRHADPRCEDDPCPAGIQWLCNAPADHPARAALKEPPAFSADGEEG